MKLETIHHNQEHSLWLVVSLFFSEQDDVSVTSELRHERGVITVDTTVEYNGRLAQASYFFPCAQDADTAQINRITAAVCGMSFYKAAIQLKQVELPWGVMTGIRPAKLIRQLLADDHSEAYIYTYLKQLYGISDEKFNLALEVAKNEIPILRQNERSDIGLYIGIPFCPTRCVYCSFVSTDLRHTARYVDEYLQLLAQEISYAFKKLRGMQLRVTNLYIGGGTPTALTEQQLARLLGSLDACTDLSALSEFCVEAGRPDTITEEKLRLMRSYHVSRISINPQTMNEATLARIGRAHTPDDIRAAFSLARQAGFDNINADIIAALPGESTADFRHTLEQVDALSPEGITVHTMSVKRGSRLHQQPDGYALTASDTAHEMLSVASSFLRQTGRIPYYMYRQKNMLGNLENVGYARPGFESLYNVNIMEEVLSVLALGSGGSSKAVSPHADRIERIFNFKSPIEYIRRFDEILTKKDAFFAIYQEMYT